MHRFTKYELEVVSSSPGRSIYHITERRIGLISNQLADSSIQYWIFSDGLLLCKV